MLFSGFCKLKVPPVFIQATYCNTSEGVAYTEKTKTGLSSIKSKWADPQCFQY